MLDPYCISIEPKIIAAEHAYATARAERIAQMTKLRTVRKHTAVTVRAFNSRWGLKPSDDMILSAEWARDSEQYDTAKRQRKIAIAKASKCTLVEEQTQRAVIAARTAVVPSQYPFEILQNYEVQMLELANHSFEHSDVQLLYGPYRSVIYDKLAATSIGCEKLRELLALPTMHPMARIEIEASLARYEPMLQPEPAWCGTTNDLFSDWLR